MQWVGSMFFFFFLKDPAPPEISPLPLHAPLPIWQTLFGLSPLAPPREGLERNRLPVISRWKVFDNLRRTLVAPATIAVLALAWLVLPGNPLAWTLGVLAAIAFPLYPLAVRFGAGPAPQQPWGVFLRILSEDVKTAGAQTLLQVTFLAYHAYEMAHAIVLPVSPLDHTPPPPPLGDTAPRYRARPPAHRPRRRAAVPLADSGPTPPR